MGFSAKQSQALRRELSHHCVRNRMSNGRELSYIEGWHAIAEANRIFGFDGWDRETVESRALLVRETRGTFLAVYAAKVRITVRAGGRTVVREGHGSGEGRGTSPGETHDLALKAAETDATKRALATFGKPFGLGLYLGGRTGRIPAATRQASIAAAAVPTPAAELGQREARPSNSEQALLAPDESRANAKRASVSSGIDKSLLTFGEPRRQRDKAHLRFVAAQPCLLCSRVPSDPHHLRFAQPRALGLKVSDEFTVPLCRTHHRELHQSGNEVAWWHDMSIEPLEIAKTLWQQTRAKPDAAGEGADQGEAVSRPVVGNGSGPAANTDGTSTSAAELPNKDFPADHR